MATTEKAIAKLMIATMIIDSHRDDREFEAISGAIKILGVTQEECDQYLNESTKIKSVEDIIAWSKPAIETLQKLNNLELSSVAITNMVLIACADNVVKGMEKTFIQASAKSLGVTVSEIQDALGPPPM